ncbi:hypothetical protein B0H19DRAFT_1274384 [Mycena capillaripes]|nr:hypothetical protein B0H19DRAFT_1274384 [Mycena capillaripes]
MAVEFGFSLSLVNYKRSLRRLGHRRFPLFDANTSAPILPPARAFSVDLHTSHAPIVACGCMQIKDLFPPSGSDSIVLYTVKLSKESMYLADAEWYSSVAQTPRGIAALLSSLYFFAYSIALKGPAAEQRVFALAYAVLRFPPAIRTLAELVLNKVPLPEEKAALAEALFHALKDFLSGARTRLRAARLAAPKRVLSAAKGEATTLAKSLVEVSPSRKRLSDPVSSNSTLVERSVAELHSPGGALYRPAPFATPFPIVELAQTGIIRQVLPRLHVAGRKYTGCPAKVDGSIG